MWAGMLALLWVAYPIDFGGDTAVAEPPVRTEIHGFRPSSYYVVIPSSSPYPSLDELRKAEHFILMKVGSPDWLSVRNFLGENEDPGVSMRFVGRSDEATDAVLYVMDMQFRMAGKNFYLHQYRVELQGETAFDWRALIAKAWTDPSGRDVVDLSITMNSLLMLLDPRGYVSTHQPRQAHKDVPPKRRKWALGVSLGVVGACLSALLIAAL